MAWGKIRNERTPKIKYILSHILCICINFNCAEPIDFTKLIIQYILYLIFFLIDRNLLEILMGTLKKKFLMI